ncbi:MAG TPA: gamma-glutamylcyclotransferase family protein [Puia sp.]|jgi:gamma-glutamylcyclotransferase (GGCT)/AIG2-like uncharacterized protein YtfP|nr:gamma-glutamylcyclotransferase family protein [Puia sp.]
MSKNYLFVYGTLRLGYQLKLKDRIIGDLRYISKGCVKGSLYDLGKYPAAVKGRVKTEIAGDVFVVNNPEKVFKILDKYENFLSEQEQNAEFVRKRSRVQLVSGKSINAWVYWYNYSPQGKWRIKSKDYFRYLKNVKRDSLVTVSL